MDEISDGKLYSSSDMVRADSLGCDGCHECCCHMGNSILLDPFDVYQMSQGLHVPAAALFNGQLQLTPVDGIVLPAIAMTSDKDQCSFLNEAGRCSIHMFRPGFCRLFPLGRVYDGTGFSYFLQTGQCKKEHLAKVKVRQWINIPELKRYEQFVCDRPIEYIRVYTSRISSGKIIVWVIFHSQACYQISDMVESHFKFFRYNDVSGFYCFFQYGSQYHFPASVKECSVCGD